MGLTIFSVNISCGQRGAKTEIRFIDCFFENASPVKWDIQNDTLVRVSLLPDYERESLNRQTDHWYFKIEAERGTCVRLIISKMIPDVYNGRLATNWWNFKNDIPCYISSDRKTWKALSTSRLPGNDLYVEFLMEDQHVYIARIPPYTISDLEKLNLEIKDNKLLKIIETGMTVERRPLEIIQLGNPDAPFSYIIRARSHPWESGGNWVVEGLIREFINHKSEKWRNTFCVYIMPMANKDGVARGMTRFNVSGMDLNRNWDKEPDPILCPEKYAFETFIKGLIKKGIKPCLGIDIHNDDYGGIHTAQHDKNDTLFLKNIQLFENLMRKHTSFSENISYSWSTDGENETNVSFPSGMLKRYGIEAIVYELNANWIGSLNKIPDKNDWINIGRNLNKVFYDYSILIRDDDN